MHRRKFIADLVRKHDWRRGAELGVAKGLTYLYLLEHCPKLYMVGVDLWAPCGHYRGLDRDGTSWAADDHEANRRKVYVAVSEFRARVALLRMSTKDAAKYFPEKMFDFVFIDADHLFEGVRDDIRAWRSKIRPGGMLIGHDIDWPSVRRAVDELCPGYEEGPDNLWYLTL